MISLNVADHTHTHTLTGYPSVTAAERQAAVEAAEGVLVAVEYNIEDLFEEACIEALYDDVCLSLNERQWAAVANHIDAHEPPFDTADLRLRGPFVNANWHTHYKPICIEARLA